MAHAHHSPRVLRLIVLAAVACLASPAWSHAQATGAFERTLTVTGRVDLTIRSGSGRIVIRPGSDGTVKISGRIRASNSWFSSDASDRIRQIEKNPPIEQAGNSIRVGQSRDESLFRNISISYDVTVPVQTTVNAGTGSGSVEVGDLQGAVEARSGSGGIEIGRVAGAVVASTGSGSIAVSGAQSLDAHSGSGSIEARGIGGAVKANSGSGSIRVEHAGKGDLDVSASSGSVVVTGVDGAAHVSASSGSVTVEGRPSGPWNIHSSSGGVTLRVPSNAAFDLDARASSGDVKSAHPVTMTGTAERHRIQGKVRGGGPLVEVSTSSGGVQLQ